MVVSTEGGRIRLECHRKEFAIPLQAALDLVAAICEGMRDVIQDNPELAKRLRDPSIADD